MLMPPANPMTDLRGEPIFGRPTRVMGVGLALFAMLALIVPALIVSLVDPVPHHRRPHVVARPIIARGELPKVDPLKFQALVPADAVSFNATIPFSTAPNPAARPFRFSGDASEMARAVDCLAAGVLYEAGDDTTGERAVAQVVINRVRHPAFPKTFCGVVFEGSDRRTGCQFTFTCDGALARHRFSDAAWERARQVAHSALTGTVFAPVGYATHYHTDWVVPYWSASLDKITAVGTHLFFRWTGWWGTPPAFNRQVNANEPVVAQLAPISPAHRRWAGDVGGPGFIGDDRGDGGANLLVALGTRPADAVPDDTDSFVYTIPKGTPPNAFRAIAMLNCGDRAYCKFLAWSSKGDAPHGLPTIDSQMTSMSFSFLRDRSRQFEKALWNCREFPRPNPQECMKTQVVAADGRQIGGRRPVVDPAISGLPLDIRPPIAASRADDAALIDAVTGRSRTRVTGTLQPPKPELPAAR